MHHGNTSGQWPDSVEGRNLDPERGLLAGLLLAAHPALHRHCTLVDASTVDSINEQGVRLTRSAADLDHLEPTTEKGDG